MIHYMISTLNVARVQKMIDILGLKKKIVRKGQSNLKGRLDKGIK